MLNFHRLALTILAEHFDLDLPHLPPDCLFERAVGRENYRKVFQVQMMGLDRQLLVYVYDFLVKPERLREQCKKQYEAELHYSTFSKGKAHAYFPAHIRSYTDDCSAAILAEMT